MLNPYPDWLNGTSVLLGFGVQFNYYCSRGIKIGFQNNFSRNFSTSVRFIFDKQESLPELKYQSVFNTNRVVRSNPLISDGDDNRLSINIQIGKNPNQYQPIAKQTMV